MSASATQGGHNNMAKCNMRFLHGPSYYPLFGSNKQANYTRISIGKCQSLPLQMYATNVRCKLVSEPKM